MPALILLLLLLGDVLKKGYGRSQCPASGLQLKTLNGVQVAEVGRTVNLSCPLGVEKIRWRVNGRPLHCNFNRILCREALTIGFARQGDSGNYSCSKEGKEASHNITLIVEEALEHPAMVCYRKVPTANIRCDWRPSRKLNSRVKCTIQIQKGYGGDCYVKNCRYFSKSRTFSCVLNHTEGDEEHYMAKMCVSTLYNRLCDHKIFTGEMIIKPDPPVKVLVKPVMRAPHKLNVTWSYPPSWNTNFYKLHFEIRYRNEHASTFITGPSYRDTYLMIDDAWPNAKHTVQVRAQEEFGYGEWSEWSSEVVGVPWSDPDQQTPTHYPYEYSESEGTFSYDYEDYTDDNLQTDDWSARVKFPDASGPHNNTAISTFTFWIGGSCLVLVIALFVGITVRYKKKWKNLNVKEEAVLSSYSPVQLVTERRETQDDTPAVPSPDFPTSVSSSESRSNEEDTPETGNFDMINMDYFLQPG
ncbi:interleukin-6 receptor subunit alpha [Latimeria chalumnae]|uniref:Interleukin 6 receptor n=1 Tax=Latimeria chalumnae TaxID=7897 RepID=M3XIQ6_LATCH|nr:PREDICTED: interleukin-6 receptor subunit alpha [Latimeria chalumnae]|eukprot:XP_005996547.2 PREDICTED: interleukin-6 receptor subunit alpha [Latimeria chalumnae]